ncbi:MAG: hypothetical protein U0787_06990 [Polyangia bacterium]
MPKQAFGAEHPKLRDAETLVLLLLRQKPSSDGIIRLPSERRFTGTPPRSEWAAAAQALQKGGRFADAGGHEERWRSAVAPLS